METYKQVRAIQRGFEVLAALNAQGASNIAQLGARTGIHRSTLYRIVDTLETLGYVRRDPRDDYIRLTPQVLDLSRGYDQGEELARAAGECLHELLSETAWPSSVGAPREEAIVISETTHGKAAVFVRNTTVGSRSPVLTSAMGRSYLAFCDDEQREEMLERIARSGSPEAPLARDSAYVAAIIDRTLDAGYGHSFGDYAPDVGSLALPVRARGRVIGGVNILFLNALISPQAAVERFLPPLARTAAAIERKLRTCSPGEQGA